MDLDKGLDQKIAQDDEVFDFVVLQKNGEPYPAGDGTECAQCDRKKHEHTDALDHEFVVKPCTIGVIGRESKRYIKHLDQVTRRLSRERRAKGKRQEISLEELYVGRVEAAVGGMMRWSGFTSGDKPAEANADNYRKALRAEHILLQVEEHIDRHAVFFENRSST